MEALLAPQSPDIQIQPGNMGAHSRRRRLRRVEVRAHRDIRAGNMLGEFQVLGGTQMPLLNFFHDRRHLSNLEKLKLRRFTLLGRQQRIARSLAALRQPSTIHLDAAEWVRLVENSEIEEEFE
jgi:hypothetical protein